MGIRAVTEKEQMSVAAIHGLAVAALEVPKAARGLRGLLDLWGFRVQPARQGPEVNRVPRDLKALRGFKALQEPGVSRDLWDLKVLRGRLVQRVRRGQRERPEQPGQQVQQVRRVQQVQQVQPEQLALLESQV